MKLRWPLVLRKTHDRVVTDISNKYAHDLEQAFLTRETDLKQCALGAVIGTRHAVMEERQRCADIAGAHRATKRPDLLRREIFHEIQNGPRARVRHPRIPDHENPTMQPESPTATSTTTTSPTR